MHTVKGPDATAHELERIIHQYQTDLLRLCYAYLHDTELAKDAVQDTFIKVYRSLSGYRQVASEKTWITRIAINTCKDIRRSAWFRHEDRHVALDSLPEPAVSPSALDMSITEAVMQLPVKLRETALLVWYQGLSLEEAAGVLGITRQAVGSRLNRCRRKLRAVMEGSDHDEA